MGEKQKIEMIPLTLYQGKELKPGEEKIVFDFGASFDDTKNQLLYDKNESFLIKESLEKPYPISPILQSMGINFPACWIFVEIPTKFLIKDWKHNKPGDIDIVAGNISINGECLFDYVVGIQIKKRRISSDDDLKPFPTGIGTKQSHYTSLMGFDKTMLIHYLIREPKSIPEGYAGSWNSIVNSDFFRAVKACKGLLKERFEKSKELFGYSLMGWGQAYGNNWKDCGGITEEIVYESPLTPLKHDSEVADSRVKLIESAKSILRRHQFTKLPFIINYKTISK